ncbi:O-antigen ligase family protein [Granulicella sp. WH15]|uniref:O-antigen ligase family protein n=1 Tax=Granulicella sp. WH15 TaxID=2602070 RepID=UPI00136781AA|nr:O-antigen ligase family protein [Granulicella sp. WH15]QHN04990.1 O-antigen ligase family protein [Granulicella sp. WH15]
MSSEQSHFAGEIAAPSPDTAMPFVVGFFFSFRLFIILLSVRALGTDPQTGTEISIALNLLLLFVVAFSTLGAADRTFGSMLYLPSIRWVLFFLAFTCCSLSWSVAASLSAAAAYWCAMAADTAMIVLLLRIQPTTSLVHSLMKGYVCGASAIAVIAWLLPTQSDLRLGDEELLGANQIGYLCAFAFFFAQYLIQQKIARYSIPAILLGVTLLRSLSKTTIVAFLVAEGFILLRDRSMSRRTKLLLLFTTALITLAFSSLLTSYFDIYSNAGNSPETLTGRLGIWAVILDEAIKQPWIGHGFYSVWKVIPPFGDFEARHAHNELIQLFYSYGAVGIAMMAGLYISFYLQIRRFTTGSLRTFYCALLIFVLIRGLADTEVFDLSLSLWAIVMFSLLMEQTHSSDLPLES